MFKFIVGAAILAMAAPAVAADGEKPISIADANLFVQQLRDMGYAPSPIDTSAESPIIRIKSSGETTSLLLAGCEGLRKCTYLAFIGSYSDVVDPPAAWVLAQNAEYDFLKVFVSDERTLAYTMSAVVEGMPRSSFRALADHFILAAAQLAEAAGKAGLIKTDPATE